MCGSLVHHERSHFTIFFWFVSKALIWILWVFKFKNVLEKCVALTKAKIFLALFTLAQMASLFLNGTFPEPFQGVSV